ncbi:MAG: hypothetical protein J3K34DRAFT_403658, partial [Monoraphidium minutum]
KQQRQCSGAGGGAAGGARAQGRARCVGAPGSTGAQPRGPVHNTHHEGCAPGVGGGDARAAARAWGVAHPRGWAGRGRGTRGGAPPGLQRAAARAGGARPPEERAAGAECRRKEIGQRAAARRMPARWGRLLAGALRGPRRLPRRVAAAWQRG